ncbi:hypothetical protein PENSPDRAFT_740522 [Peniophora sp. CONT]|nr:hypothetical protein PENSPDRAFT_740522 [Peniophora sp. CONT]
MYERIQTYRLYLAAQYSRRTERVKLGFLLTRCFKAGVPDAPLATSLWPTVRAHEGRSYILPTTQRHDSLNIEGLRALVVLEDSLPLKAPEDAFALPFEGRPVREGQRISTQTLAWSYDVFMMLTKEGMFDYKAGSLLWSTIVDLMRALVQLPPSPIPTYDLRGRRIDAFTLPPPPSNAARVDVGPRNPERQLHIPHPPPSPVKSEDRWSSCSTIGIGEKYDPYSPAVHASTSASTSAFAQQQDRYIIHRTTTHHRTEREKENLDVRTQRRRTRKVSKPEPRPEIIEHVPRHREALRPRPILKPYTRYGPGEQDGGWTPQRVGLDLYAPRYRAEPVQQPQELDTRGSHSREHTSARRARRGHAQNAHEEMYVKAEERVRVRMSRA